MHLRTASLAAAILCAACYSCASHHGRPDAQAVPESAEGEGDAAVADASDGAPPVRAQDGATDLRLRDAGVLGARLTMLCGWILEAPCDAWSHEPACVQELLASLHECSGEFETYLDCVGDSGATFTCEPVSGYPVPRSQGRDGTTVACDDAWFAMTDCLWARQQTAP